MGLVPAVRFGDWAVSGNKPKLQNNFGTLLTTGIKLMDWLKDISKKQKKTH